MAHVFIVYRERKRLMLNSDLFSRNLYMYRTKAGMTQKEVAEKIGIRQQTVAAWEANRSTPCPDIIGMLAKMFGITTDQLLLEQDGRGNALMGKIKKVPIVSHVKAGFQGHTEDELLGYEYIDGDYDAEYVFVHVEGDSMAPQIMEGDLALIHLQEDVENGEVAVVMIENQLSSLKRVLKQAGGILLQPFNTSYPAQFFPTEALYKIRILGKLVKTMRRW